MDEAFESKVKKIEVVANDLPAVIIIHSIETLVVDYMSPRGLKILGLTLKELKEMGKEYFVRYFNPKDVEDYLPKVLRLLEKADENEIFSFFQQVRPSATHDWSWHLSTTKIFHKDSEGKPSHIITFAYPIDPLHHITAKVNRLLEENNFLRKNQHIFRSLTAREKQILRLMALGDNSVVIAEKLHISEKTVTTHRRNIRSKIKAESKYDITKFAQAFDLI